MKGEYPYCVTCGGRHIGACELTAVAKRIEMATTIKPYPVKLIAINTVLLQTDGFGNATSEQFALDDRGRLWSRLVGDNASDSGREWRENARPEAI